MHRRDMLTGLGAAALAARPALAAGRPPWLSPQLPDGTREEATLQTLPGKQPLICLADRPPNYETPIDAFRTEITGNDRFFVRYHLADVPDMAALEKWSLTVGGDAAQRQVDFSLADLRKLPEAEITAVCQCSGNRRGLFNPHVAGVEWGYGAMGNAVWRGAKLKDVLAKAGVKPECRGGMVPWHGRSGAASNAGVPQKPATGEGTGGRGHHRLVDERPVTAALQRLSRAP